MAWGKHEIARDALDRALGPIGYHDTIHGDPLAKAVYNSAVRAIIEILEQRETIEEDDDAAATRSILEPSDRRDRVTKASRLLVHAAGGRIEVPFHLSRVVDEIELDQTDEPHRSRVVYTTHYGKGHGATGTVVDATAVEPPMKRIGPARRADEEFWT